MPQNQTHSFCFLSIVKVLKALSATGQKYLFDEFGATNFLALMEGVTHFGPGGIQGCRYAKILGGDKSMSMVGVICPPPDWNRVVLFEHQSPCPYTSRHGTHPWYTLQQPARTIKSPRPFLSSIVDRVHNPTSNFVLICIRSPIFWFKVCTNSLWRAVLIGEDPSIKSDNLGDFWPH